MSFGSDWPFAPDSMVAFHTGHLDATDTVDTATHARINRSNAEALFPRLRAD